MKLEPQGRFGRPFRFVERCESTQDLFGPDDPEGSVVVTDEQTAGRGRQGRRWLAPAGKAILSSTLLRPPPSRRQPELSLVAGVAVADAVEEALGLSAQIKWPNDVLVNRKKVAGILAEARDGAVILGIGVNVNQRREELPREATTPAASLLTVDGVARDREPILVRLLARLEHHYDLWREGGLDAIYVDLGSRDFLRGRRVRVDGLEGVAEGVDREGRLLVSGQAIESGEVEYER